MHVLQTTGRTAYVSVSVVHAMAGLTPLSLVHAVLMIFLALRETCMQQPMNRVAALGTDVADKEDEELPIHSMDCL